MMGGLDKESTRIDFGHSRSRNNNNATPQCTRSFIDSLSRRLRAVKMPKIVLSSQIACCHIDLSESIDDYF